MTKMPVNLEEIEKLILSKADGRRARQATVEQVVETIGVYNLWVILAEHWGLGEPVVRRACGAVSQGYRQAYGRPYSAWITVGGSDGLAIDQQFVPSKDRPKWTVACRSARPVACEAYQVGNVLPTWSKRLGLRWSWWRSPF